MSLSWLGVYIIVLRDLIYNKITGLSLRNPGFHRHQAHLHGGRKMGRWQGDVYLDYHDWQSYSGPFSARCARLFPAFLQFPNLSPCLVALGASSIIYYTIRKSGGDRWCQLHAQGRTPAIDDRAYGPMSGPTKIRMTLYCISYHPPLSSMLVPLSSDCVLHSGGECCRRLHQPRG